LTVPVDSFEAYRNWLGEACQILPTNKVRILDEPTAAALGYGIEAAKLLLVIDFGGGTLDLSLVKVELSPGQQPLGFILKWGTKKLADSSAQKPKIARVLAKTGQNLGGTDIDNWIAEYFARDRGIEISPVVIRLAERLKIQLSLANSASEVYFDDETFESYELELNRDRLEAILREHQFFERIKESLSQLLQQARRQGIEVADIDAVLLVGGTVKIPAVQEQIEQYFDKSKIRCEKPFEAIALGALQVSLGVEVKDFLYHSYGIRYWDRRKNCHSWHPLIRSGQAYPLADPVKLVLGASIENQSGIELIIGELGVETGGTEVYFEGDRLVTRRLGVGERAVQPLNDKEGARTLATLDPPGYPGSDRVELEFYIDDSRFLVISVRDLLANQVLLEKQRLVRLS